MRSCIISHHDRLIVSAKASEAVKKVATLVAAAVAEALGRLPVVVVSVADTIEAATAILFAVEAAAADRSHREVRSCRDRRGSRRNSNVGIP